MRIKLNEEENNICKKHIINYLIDNCDMNDVINYIKENYPKFIVDNMDLFEVINEFYIDENKYEEFKSNISYEYVIDNLKELTLTNIKEGMTYYPKINDDDMKVENFVDNGTLVLRMNRLISYRLEPKYRINSTKAIDEYIKIFETKISNKIGVNTRILMNDKITMRK